MNYGKKGTERMRRSFSKQEQKKKLIGVFFLKILLALCLLALAGGICFGIYYMKGVIANAPDIQDIDATPSGYMSTVLDADGNVTAELVASGSNRVYVTLDEIPANLQHAFVAIEDSRFYEHNGIDIKGILRAGVKGITSGHFSEGASTITQQLLKNNVFDGWTNETSSRRVERKIQEQYLALQLEKTYSKDWIMENYLNTINLGQNTLGVQAASKRYFGKDVSDLTLSECSVLAGITKNPSRYNPISYPEANAKRREKVLGDMLEQEFISQAEYDEAMADYVYERIQDVNTQTTTDGSEITSYFVDALTDQVINDLQKKLGYSEAESYKALYSGGITIYSTQDPKIQKICDKQVNNKENYSEDTKVSFSYALSIEREDGTVENYSQQTMLSYYQKKNKKYNITFDTKKKAQKAVDKYRETMLKAGGGKVAGETLTFVMQPQTSVTVLDQKTGQVKALVGGRGTKTASKTLNRATDTVRQPGSTFKILSTYAPALDSGDFTLATTQMDEPYAYESGKEVNNYNFSYQGYTNIRTAITNSINVIAVKTLTEVTPQVGIDYLKQFGITTLTKQDVVQSLALGGITNGVKNEELTAAYAAIANGGKYVEPILYTKIVDHDGNVLLENKPKSHRVLKDSTAYLLTSAMEDVVSEGTGVAANFSGMSIAGKTGTTSDNRDAWFAGYTPYYTCVVWGGKDDYSVLESTKYPKVIWKEIMSRVNDGLEDTGFKKPKKVKRISVCRTSGKIALKGICDDTYVEYFADGTQPKKYCDLHVQATICKDSGLLAGPYCPDESKETKVFIKKGSSSKYKRVPKKTCDKHTEEQYLKDQLKDKLNQTINNANGVKNQGTGSTNNTSNNSTTNNNTNNKKKTSN